MCKPGHRQTLAAAPKEAAECSNEVGKSESEVSLSLDLVNGKQDKETLYSGKFDEPRKMRMRSEVQGEVVEKKLYFKKQFTRGLTTMGGKLVKEIQKESGARVDIIPSPGIEQTVVLKGPLLLVENAERMLMELQSSVLEINLSYEEKNMLVADGWCLMTKLRRRLQVPARLQGSKLMLMGKPEDTKRDSEVLKEELRRILKEPVRVEVPEGHEVKKLTLDKTFTKALTSNGGKLVKEIQYRSGAKVDIIPSPGIEENVVLKGPLLFVENAKGMLMELQSSAQELSLSYEEKTALLSGGKGCLMKKLQVMLQVALGIEGRKLVLFGKSDDSKKAMEIIEEELRKTLAY